PSTVVAPLSTTEFDGLLCVLAPIQERLEAICAGCPPWRQHLSTVIAMKQLALGVRDWYRTGRSSRPTAGDIEQALRMLLCSGTALCTALSAHLSPPARDDRSRASAAALGDIA